MIQKILFSLAMLVASIAFAGPESGGGGNVCPTPTMFGGTELTALDLINGPSVYHSMRLAVRRADRIEFSAAEKQSGIKFTAPSSNLMRGVTIVFEDLQHQHADDIAKIILKSIRDLKMIAVPRLPGTHPIGADFRDSQPLCTAKNAQAAILYDWKIGVVVSATIWNQLSEANQVALLIHEGLRNIQIRYRYGFSNYALQRLTQLLMTGKTQAFIRLFNAARARSPVTTPAAKARLCAPKNREIALDLTAFAENNADKKPVDPKLLAMPYFTAACTTGRAEDIWNLMDFMMSDLNMEDNWGSWKLTDQDFNEFNLSITNAYYATYGAVGRDLGKTWADVYWARAMMWAAPLEFDGKTPFTPEDIRGFWARIKQVYGAAN